MSVSLFDLLELSPLHLLIPLVIVQRLLELRRARRNDGWLRSKGAVEHGAEHYASIITVHVLWFAGMIAEIVLLSRTIGELWPLWLGLFAAGQLLRYWTIRTLGRRWSTRVLVLPRARPVTTGPYRFLRHPNYVAVAIELAALPLLYGATVTATAISILNAVVLRRRIRIEDAALHPAR
jgi:methyltransferase